MALIKKITLSFFILLLFSVASFASNEKDLSHAIKQNNIKDVKKLLNDEKVDPRKIKHFYTLPSSEISKLLLENDGYSLDADKFLQLVLNYDCYIWDLEKNTYKLDYNLLKQRGILAKLALKKGAQAQKISDFGMLPSLKLSKLLLSKGLKPDKFYLLILKHTEYNYENRVYELINNLLELALIKGANPKKEINAFAILPSLKFSKLLLAKGLDPNKFYCLILKYMEYNSEKNSYGHANSLLKFALGKGANIKKINELLQKEFNPQATNFSNIKTIKSWVASKHHQEKTMEILQRYIATLVPQNKPGIARAKIISQVPQVKGTKYLGFTFPTLAGAELPFLQHVNKISKSKKIITLEIAAANGFVSWKVPLAFENSGIHYANDFSLPAVKNLKNTVFNIFQQLQNPKLASLIKTIPGDCFDILNKHPELKNKVDVIFVQNLEHFFNPTQHRKFLALIEELLAPRGYVFLSANSPYAYNYSNKTGLLIKSLLEKSNSSDINNVYSAFVQIDQQLENSDEDRILDAKHPKNEEIECAVKHLENKSNSKSHKLVIRNLFTPEIYRKTLRLNTSLEIIDSFYMDNMGLRLNNGDWEYPNTIGNAVVIARKP